MGTCGGVVGGTNNGIERSGNPGKEGITGKPGIEGNCGKDGKNGFGWLDGDWTHLT